jgi:hypothetical protein
MRPTIRGKSLAVALSSVNLSGLEDQSRSVEAKLQPVTLVPLASRWSRLEYKAIDHAGKSGAGSPVLWDQSMALSRRFLPLPRGLTLVAGAP